jgi:N,N'-diacetyllegionaminate synthase
MVASTKLPIIFSAGIGSTLKSIQETISIIRQEYEEADITVLHCNNAYPTPIEDINLNQLDKIKEQFLPAKMGGIWFRNYGTDQAIKMGLSDHTLEAFTPSLAVAKGATCIEKHFTLCNHLEGPDHKFAMPPEKLRIMIDMIKEAELMCKSTNHDVTNSEKEFTKAMRSVVASQDIKKGERLTLQNLTTKRPFLENCIAAKDYYNIIGNMAECDIETDKILEESDVRR